MNILILNWRGPGHPQYGGAEIVTLEHCRYWQSRGHTVFWFTSKVSGSPAHETVDGITIVRRGLDVLGVQLTAFYWYLFVHHPKFDVVIDQFHGIPFFTPLYVRVPIIGFIHEVATKVWHLNPWPRPLHLLPAFFGRIFEPLVFFLYRRIPFWTVSSSTRTDLKKFGIQNVKVIPNGFTVPVKFQIHPKEPDFTAIHLSVLTPDKGVADSITAFATFHTTYPKSSLWIVGKGDPDYLHKLHYQVKELGLQNSVVFYGYVDETKKFELLSRAWVLLNPSVHEGWGLTNIEANSVGTPVVGYAVSGMVDSVKAGITGYLTPAGDVSGLSISLARIAASQNPFHFSPGCISWSRNFSWSKSLQQSLKLLQHVK